MKKSIKGPLGVQIPVDANGQVGIYSLIKAVCEVLQLQSDNRTNGEGYRMLCRVVHGLLTQLNVFH